MRLRRPFTADLAVAYDCRMQFLERALLASCRRSRHSRLPIPTNVIGFFQTCFKIIRRRAHPSDARLFARNFHQEAAPEIASIYLV